jgi:nicotinate-nucleotide pyrophosphorylase (carboxylating)
VQAIEGTRAVICDTRKTTPGLRGLEKYAVRCGGGTTHRLGLFDAMLIKDNHIVGVPIEKLARTLSKAVIAARNAHALRFVEVEVDSLQQFQHVLKLDAGLVDVVLLDNMSVGELRDASLLRSSHRPDLLLEASGGVTLDNVRSIASTGVDRISVGAITHSAPALDIGLDIT